AGQIVVVARKAHRDDVRPGGKARRLWLGADHLVLPVADRRAEVLTVEHEVHALATDERLGALEIARMDGGAETHVTGISPPRAEVADERRQWTLATDRPSQDLLGIGVAQPQGGRRPGRFSEGQRIAGKLLVFCGGFRPRRMPHLAGERASGSVNL